MPDRVTQRELDKLRALFQLIDEDGATPAGKIPAAHVSELRAMDSIDRERIDQITEAHANGNAPPNGGI